MNMNMTMTMVMQTTFYSDTSFEFLFDDWEVTNSSTYFGALAGLFFLSMVLSLLNFGLSHIEAQMVK
jgi:Ctr copper transporter family